MARDASSQQEGPWITLLIQGSLDSFYVVCVYVLNSVPSGYQHEKSIQELHHPGPTGGLQKLNFKLSNGDVPTVRQATASQYSHSLQVSSHFRFLLYIQLFMVVKLHRLIKKT